ncbi:hypothetical protein SAMCCGM7_pC1993 (plasmid) [Sinorhizobium americanum CCGM7]|nr:hypothetical protein SAMCCGM7_pC1993 [Sinorhizobium americanum CCGM7]
MEGFQLPKYPVFTISAAQDLPEQIVVRETTAAVAKAKWPRIARHFFSMSCPPNCRGRSVAAGSAGAYDAPIFSLALGTVLLSDAISCVLFMNVARLSGV